MKTRPERMPAPQTARAAAQRQAQAHTAAPAAANPRELAQRERIRSAFGSGPTQRAAEEDELQMKAEATEPNREGVPDALKNGVEALSGPDLSDVRLHGDSARPAQLRANKFVTPHAKTHFGDWGPMYGITSEPQLKAKVPDSVQGDGSIDLGLVEAPVAEQTRVDKTKYKDCSIAYKDGKKTDETTIFACGPLGPTVWK